MRSHLRSPAIPRGLWLAGVAALVLHGVGTWAIGGSGWAGRGDAPQGGPVDGRQMSHHRSVPGTALQVRLQGTRGQEPVAPWVSQASARPSPPTPAQHLASMGANLDQAPPAAGGDASLATSYLPAESVDQGPAPDLGWLIDEAALPQVPRVRLLLRLWVSEHGRIDRVMLMEADPPGPWADRVIEPLPDTLMRPAQRGGKAVPATAVVEITADLESMR